MKVSLDWIKDYVALPQDLDLKKLAYDLTMSTVEVEDVEDLAERFNRIVVGQIAAIEAHPNAEKLRICKTDIGGEIKDIVCGGINLREGMKVAVSLPGAMVRWHGEGEPVEIKETKLRGVPSFGMICASSEIGLGDLFPAKEEAEIVDLSFLDCPAGTPIADALDLHDILLSIMPLLTIGLPGLCIAGLALVEPKHLQIVLLALLFAVPTTCDTLAFFVGSRIGGPKLCPTVSPHKTISGAIGGMVGALLAVLIVALIANAAVKPEVLPLLPTCTLR